MFDFVKEALNQVPFFIDISILIETNYAGPFGWDNRLCFCLIEGTAEMVGIIALLART